MGRTVIEITHPNRFRKVYRVFDGDEVRVGRSFDNDLILPDPFVSERHLLITAGEAGWSVEDLGSLNGLFTGRGGTPAERVLCRSGDEIVVGRTRLRLLSPSHAVGPARRLVRESAAARFARHPAGALLGVLAMAGLLTLEVWLGSWQSEPLLKHTPLAMTMLLLLLLWSGIWAFAGRLLVNRASFFMHLSLGCVFVVAVSLGEHVASWAGYLAGSEKLEHGAFAVLAGGAFTFLLSRSLGASTHMEALRRVTWSGVLSLVLVCLFFFFAYTSKEEFSTEPSYYGTIKPPLPLPLGSSSVEEFLQGASGIFVPAESSETP